MPEGDYTYLIQLKVDKRSITKASKDLNAAVAKLSAKLDQKPNTNIKNLTDQFRKLGDTATNSATKVSNSSKLVSKSATRMAKSSKYLNRQNKKTAAGFGSMVKRALAMVPAFFIAKTAFSLLSQAITNTASHIVGLDAILTKSQSVTNLSANQTDNFRFSLASLAEQLSADTGRDVREVAESYYQLATAGLAVQASFSGMEVALKTAIGTHGDVTQTAKLLATVYNVLGDNIEGAVGESQKMKKIGDTLATLWKDNTINTDEFIKAIKNFAPTAKSYQLTLNETFQLAAAAATLGSTGSNAGTQLSRGFVFLQTHAKEVNRQLERTVNFTKENPYKIYREVIDSLNKDLNSGRIIGSQVTGIFGKKGSKTTAAFIANLKVLRDAEALLRKDVSGASDELYNLELGTLENQLKRFPKLIGQVGAAFFESAFGTSKLTSAVKNLNNSLDSNIKKLKQSANQYRSFFSFLGKNSNFLTGLTKGLVDSAPEEQITYSKRFGRGKRTKVTKSSREISEGSLPGIFDDPSSVISKELRQQYDEIQQLINEASRKKVGTRRGRRGIRKSIFARDRDAQERLFSRVYELTNNLELARASVPKSVAGSISEKVLTDLESKKSIEEEGKRRDISDQLVGQAEKLSTTLERNLVATSRLTALGYTRLEILNKQLDLVTSSKDVEDKKIEIIKLQNQQYVAQAEILNNSLKGSLANVITGDSSFSNALSKIGDTIQDQIAEATAERLVNSVNKKTGIGGIFSEFITSLQGKDDSIGAVIESAHKEGGISVKNSILEAYSNISPHVPGQAQGQGGLEGAAGGLQSIDNLINKASGSTKKPFLQRDIISPTPLEGPYGPPSAQYPQGKPPVGASSGGILGGSGFTAGQALGAASAVNSLINLKEKQGSGDVAGGALQGGIAGFQLGSTIGGPVGGAIGAAVGAAYGAIQAGKSKTTTEVTQETVQIASKIDITNKSLAILNRNFVDLSQKIETFILPDSSYFTQQFSSIASDFSKNSRRGFS